MELKSWEKRKVRRLGQQSSAMLSVTRLDRTLWVILKVTALGLMPLARLSARPSEQKLSATLSETGWELLWWACLRIR